MVVTLWKGGLIRGICLRVAWGAQAGRRRKSTDIEKVGDRFDPENSKPGPRDGGLERERCSACDLDGHWLIRWRRSGVRGLLLLVAVSCHHPCVYLRQRPSIGYSKTVQLLQVGGVVNRLVEIGFHAGE